MSGYVGHQAILDRDHLAGTGSVYGYANQALRFGDELPLEDLVARADHRCRGRANVLRQGDDELWRDAGTGDWCTHGLPLVFRRVYATVKAVNTAHAARSSEAPSSPSASVAMISTRRLTGSGNRQCQLCSVSSSRSISMQSTGQGSTHRSQPVHSLAMTVCICLAAPSMASTGHAWMHLVQPMHSSSRIKATAGLGLSSPCSASSGITSRSSRSASAWMPASPPGGHLLIASPAAIASA